MNHEPSIKTQGIDGVKVSDDGISAPDGVGGMREGGAAWGIGGVVNLGAGIHWGGDTNWCADIS